jgi:hypothetical protein
MENERIETPEMTPDRAVLLFLAESALPWLAFFLVLMDGSFLPPSADSTLLYDAAHHFGVAGFVGLLSFGSASLQVKIRPVAQTPEGERALMSAVKEIERRIVNAPQTVN